MSDYIWGLDPSADASQDVSWETPVYDPSSDPNASTDYWESDAWENDSSWAWEDDDYWDDDWDTAFSDAYNVGSDEFNTGEQPLWYNGGSDALSLGEYGEVESKQDPEDDEESWLDILKGFATSDMGKQMIIGSLSGGAQLFAQEQRAEDERKFREAQAALQREHEIKMQKLKNSGSGRYVPAAGTADKINPHLAQLDVLRRS